MSLQTRLEALVTAIGADIKALKNATATAPAWTAVTYGTNWRRVADSASYEVQSMKLPDGTVLIRGIAERITSAYSYPSTVFTLQSDHRPDRQVYLFVQSQDGAAAFGRLRLVVNTDGTCVLDQTWDGANNGAAGSNIYLDGQSFKAAGQGYGGAGIGKRIVSGIVNADGSKAVSSTEYTVARLGPGEYTVTFPTAFTSIPAVSAMARSGVSGDKTVQHDTTDATTTSFRVSVRDPTASGATLDVGFHFIAVATDQQAGNLPATLDLKAYPLDDVPPIFLPAGNDDRKMKWTRSDNGGLVADVWGFYRSDLAAGNETGHLYATAYGRGAGGQAVAALEAHYENESAVDSTRSDTTGAEVVVQAQAALRQVSARAGTNLVKVIANDGTSDFAKSANVSRDQSNASVANQAGFAADTYLAGSAIAIPTGKVKIGSKYRLKFNVVKTAAGTATPIVSIRVGTAGSVADAARAVLTFAAQSAVVDEGVFEFECVFRAADTTAVLQALGSLGHRLATTGLSAANHSVAIATSAAFDVSLANLIIGASVNGGTNAAWTVSLVSAELLNLTH